MVCGVWGTGGWIHFQGCAGRGPRVGCFARVRHDEILAVFLMKRRTPIQESHEYRAPNHLEGQVFFLTETTTTNPPH